MRKVRKGDLVINCYDGLIRGQSIAATDCYTTDKKPPKPGDWDFAHSFFRFDLESFREIKDSVSLTTLGSKYKERIRDEIVTDHPKYYIFSWWPCTEFYPEGRIVVSQGRFLATATPLICRLINELTGLGEGKTDL